MTFQCAIFQTSAALESYLKLIIESWFQQLKTNKLGSVLPSTVRGRIAADRLVPQFESYIASRDEGAIYTYLGGQIDLWSVMVGGAEIPPYLTGKHLHDGRAYPSNKNLKRLFLRLGIPSVHGEIAKLLKRDVDAMIEGFQSVRTAIAHSAPPSITIKDVKRLLHDMKSLVRAIDRVFFRHVVQHGGIGCCRSRVGTLVLTASSVASTSQADISFAQFVTFVGPSAVIAAIVSAGVAGLFGLHSVGLPISK